MACTLLSIARYALRSIILTSNRALSDWTGIFPDKVMANALMDRFSSPMLIKSLSKWESFQKEKYTSKQ